jgi:hypothetical protein
VKDNEAHVRQQYAKWLTDEGEIAMRSGAGPSCTCGEVNRVAVIEQSAE